MWVSCSENKRCQNWLQRWVETSAICERMSRTTTTVSPSYWVAYWLRARMMRECKLSVKNGDDVGERVWISYNVAWTCGTYIQTDRQTVTAGDRIQSCASHQRDKKTTNDCCRSLSASVRETHREIVQCSVCDVTSPMARPNYPNESYAAAAEQKTFVSSVALSSKTNMTLCSVNFQHWQHGTRHSVHLRHATLKSAQCRCRPA